MLGHAIDKKMQNVWAAPLVKSINTLEKFSYFLLLGNIMRTLLEEVVDIRGIVGQCPTLKTLGGIGKCMCHTT